MQIIRQNTRYHPNKGSNYYELNITLSEYLDEFKFLFKEKKILDIGAGEIPFKSYYKDLNIVTCDIQNNSTNTIDVLIKPGELLPFKDETFEVIFIFDVLEHIYNDIEFLKECNRILKKNGLIVANVPFMYRFHEIPFDYRRYTPSGLNIILSESSFKILQQKNIGSVTFVAKTILLESQVKIKSVARKILFKIILILLDIFNNRKEISTVSPFSIFFIAEKK